MSEENVETLRRAFEAFNSADIERIVAFVHPRFHGEIPPELSPEPDTYSGHDGIRRYFRTFWEAMEDIRFEPERIWDAGGSMVAVSMRMTARGRQTGIAVEQRFHQVWTLSEGKIIAVGTYATVAQALAHAGLERS
jgi:ketosteroid isomerase-like protein